MTYCILVGSLRYRRGTVYYGVQYSKITGKTRILAYGTNKIHHHGQGFGTNPLESTSTVINDLKKGLSKNSS
jgi:hypothetical protein